ncbi:MAG: hypothetical protein JXQ96_08885 [Cyclobacteriaceae bacterium]
MKPVYIPLMILLIGCNSIDKEEVVGLWELHEVKVDAMQRTFDPTFLEIRSNNSFAVSRVTGDMSGLFDVKDAHLNFQSRDNHWFGRGWKVHRFSKYLILKDTAGNWTSLKFKRIEKVPNFQEFENRLIGNWELYKLRREGKPERVADTWFDIGSDGSYKISTKESVLESGHLAINTRHKKVIFEHDSTLWDAWFFGKELRLANNQLGIQYSLRK